MKLFPLPLTLIQDLQSAQKETQTVYNVSSPFKNEYFKAEDIYTAAGGVHVSKW